MNQDFTCYTLTVRQIVSHTQEKNQLVLRLNILYGNGIKQQSCDMFKLNAIIKPFTYEAPLEKNKHQNLCEYNQFQFRIYLEKAGVISNSTIRTLVSSPLVMEKYMQEHSTDTIHEVVASDVQGSMTVRFSVSPFNPFQNQEEILFATPPGGYGSATFRELSTEASIYLADMAFNNMVKTSNSATLFCSKHAHLIDVINFVSEAYKQFPMVTVFYRKKIQSTNQNYSDSTVQKE